MIDPAVVLDRLGIAYKRDARGRLHAPCPHPDHKDRSPSWMFWADADDGGLRHKCISCGWGGGGISLVSKVLGLAKDEAAAWLASSDRAGPGSPLEAEVDVWEAAGLSYTRVPDGVRQEPLEGWPTPARRYVEDRGVTPEQVDAWGLGYAVGGKLAGRVFIPVRNRKGQLEGWTGRSFDDRTPKYREPSRDDQARAGALFGEAAWDRYPPTTGVLVVAEGPFDGLAADAVGFPFGVLRGSDLHPNQARKLARWPLLVVATDPDQAGEKAAALLSGLGRHVRITQARVPRGDDLSSIYQEDPSRLAGILRTAVRRAG